MDLDAGRTRAWSIHDDEGITPYDVRTMSTAAHHSSAVTIMAGLTRKLVPWRHSMRFTQGSATWRQRIALHGVGSESSSMSLKTVNVMSSEHAREFYHGIPKM